MTVKVKTPNTYLKLNYCRPTVYYYNQTTNFLKKKLKT